MGAKLCTQQEAAQILGCNERTIRRRIKAGKLNTVDIGGRVMVQLVLPDVEDTEADMPGDVQETPSTDARKPGESGRTRPDSDRDIHEKLEAALQARIDHLEEENRRLWNQLDRMLPAPAAPPPQPEPGAVFRGWLIVALLAVGVVAIWIWALSDPGIQVLWPG